MYNIGNKVYTKDGVYQNFHVFKNDQRISKCCAPSAISQAALEHKVNYRELTAKPV